MQKSQLVLLPLLNTTTGFEKMVVRLHFYALGENYYFFFLQLSVA
jgi:hypothetical protein